MDAKSLAIKFGLGLTGVGAVSALTYQGYKFFNTEEKIESNKKQIEKEGYTILSHTSTDVWSKILESYKEAEESLRFQDFDGKNVNSALSTLKSKCGEALESSDKKLLNKSRRWCVTPIKPSVLLVKRGLKVLKTEVNQANVEVAQWTDRLNSFKAAKQNDSSLAQLIVLVEGEQKDAENIVKMKTKCKELDNKMSHEKEFESNLKNLEAWCIDKTS